MSAVRTGSTSSHGRLLALIAIAALLVGLPLTGVSTSAVAAPADSPTIERLSGPNRYATAAAVATTQFTPGVGAVYIASGATFPDALAGAARAGANDDPILLTRANSLPAATAEALTTLQPQRIVVLGGTASVTENVRRQLEAYTAGSVTRIGGSDRYATAAQIGATFPSSTETVFVAAGTDYPDALTAAARAGQLGSPVLLTRPGSLPPATAAQLQRIQPERVVLLGGTGAVSDAVLAEIAALSATVERIGGATRYETATLLAQTYDAPVATVYLASGADFPDALAAAPAAAAQGAPVVLTRPTQLHPVLHDLLPVLDPDVVRVVGGTGALSDTVVDELTAVLAPSWDVVVAQDGSGDFTTVAEAVRAAPDAATEPWVIGIRPGTYLESFEIDKPYLTLVGTTGAAEDVVISDDKHAGGTRPDGGTWGTTGSATLLIGGDDVTLQDLTVENAYEETGSGSEQAVAVKTEGDRQVYDNVRFLGNQDTLYVNSPSKTTRTRAYFKDCYVEGDVDFIFGRGTAVFDGCTLHALSRGSDSNNGYITAASTDISQTYGYLITDSVITSDAPAATFSLGRPWQPSNDPDAIGQVLVRDTELPAAIKPAPWADMSIPWEQARFSEFQNTGPGAGTGTDRPQMSAAQAEYYDKWDYLAGDDGWNPTGEPVVPNPPDTQAPEAPLDLSATAGDGLVSLAWTPGTETDLVGYHVYRQEGTTVDVVEANRITSTVVGEPSYLDRTAVNGTSYAYAVTAVDAAGNESAGSAAVTATPESSGLPPHDLLVSPGTPGAYATVQEALDAAPAGTVGDPTVIAITPGVYHEKITVNTDHVTLLGTSGDAVGVVLQYDDWAGRVPPGETAPIGTGNSQSVDIRGDDITVRDLTIANSYEETGTGSEQAVALKTTGDRLVFDNVRLLGNQDTLLVNTPNVATISRALFVDSYIEGDVDFIFGRGTAVFLDSELHALDRGSSSNNGYLTAASTAENNPYGFLIVDSTVTSQAAAGSVHLGRPWRGWADGTQVADSRGQVTFRNTTLPAAIDTVQPWVDMDPLRWDDGRFSEYQNTGPGATVNDFRPQLSDAEAAERTPQSYLAGTDGWNPLP